MDLASGGEAPRSSTAAASFRPLRVWPGLILAGLTVVARFGPRWLEGGMSRYWMIGAFGPLLCCLLVVIWWLTGSRATRKERLIGCLGLIVSFGVTWILLDSSMRGVGAVHITVPIGVIAFVLGTLFLARRRPVERTGLALTLAFCGFGFSVLLRSEGASGDYMLTARWRWSPTAEALMLADRDSTALAGSHRPDPDAIKLALGTPEWPGFRGADRAAVSRGPQISTNWSGAQAPRPLWKIRVGPGWSSFAVAGQFLFTQEQRGPMEAVVCYDAETGREVWSRQTETRLDDSMGGPGPRATPTLAKGGLFATGSTGIFMRLDPVTGEVVWHHDLKKIAHCEVPMWGFAASPLVTGSMAITYAGGPEDKGVLAFDAESGDLIWSVAAGRDSYSSPQLNAIAGEVLVLMMSKNGLLFLDPLTGKPRLNYEWAIREYRALQPRLVGDDTILIPTGIRAGTRAIRITKTNGQLEAKELWTSRYLKPDFTDLVTYEGYIYGMDAGIFTCVELKSGDRRWKGGRYGKGQVLLLENSGLLLIAAEQGQVVLLRADPDAHVEIGSFPALEGKTWNHPVVVGDRLYIRNAQEAACYQLPLAESKALTGG